ncbi:coenzyme F420-dependent N5 N10-methylene tetrahydromethanopterin reductase-like protein [Actinoplanes sp. N902-109]|nr:coenzyme F420-dependent N5 N10-methylene tetrahydromethanopterin reductase-like protein [Actinoplanes sp. N902-109]
MRIGVALPAAVPGRPVRELLTWARRAEEHGYSCLAALDRLVYDNCEPLIALSAAAAVTERIGIAATALIAPYRGSAALLAKQLATLDRLSAGRLVVGLAAGGREDDFRAAGVPYARRGARLDAMVEAMRQVWSGEAIGPRPAGAPLPLVFGGHTGTAIRRAARYGQGWISGGSSASGYRDLVERARAGWAEAGRTDQPRLMALGYVALGPNGRELAAAYVDNYYAFLGPGATARITAGVLTDDSRLKEAVAGYAEAGCEELILVPCAAGIDQLERISGVVL